MTSIENKYPLTLFNNELNEFLKNTEIKINKKVVNIIEDFELEEITKEPTIGNQILLSNKREVVIRYKGELIISNPLDLNNKEIELLFSLNNGDKDNDIIAEAIIQSKLNDKTN